MYPIQKRTDSGIKKQHRHFTNIVFFIPHNFTFLTAKGMIKLKRSI